MTTSPGPQTVGGRDYPTPDGNVGTAETMRAEYGISREAQDALALRSHQRAVGAHASGAFDAEFVPVEVPGCRGSVILDRDEHPRADTSIEALAAPRPVLQKSDPAATVTAGNSSGQNDAAHRMHRDDAGTSRRARTHANAAAPLAGGRRRRPAAIRHRAPSPRRTSRSPAPASASTIST